MGGEGGNLPVRLKALRRLQGSNLGVVRLATTDPDKGKRPLGKGWHKKPVPWAVAEEHVRNGGNLGVICGRYENVTVPLIVFDVDCATLEEAMALIEKLGLPRTWMVKSGRKGGGGFHLYYRMPDGFDHGSTLGGLAPLLKELGFPKDAVDIRGTGGQVVSAGSIHPASGDLYQWVEHHSPANLPITELPERFQKLLKEAKPKPEPVTTVEGSGQRELIGGVDSFNAAHAQDWETHNRACPFCGHNGCFDPHHENPAKWFCFSTGHTDYGQPCDNGHWGDALDYVCMELGKDGSATSRAEVLRETGYLEEPELPVVDISGFLEKHAHLGPPDSPIVTEWSGKRLDWFTDKPPKRRYLLRHPDGKGLLPLGKAATLSSAGGVGKTHAVMQLALSIATGRHWLDHFAVCPEAPRRVLLLLGEEDTEEAHRRIYNVAAALHLTEHEQQTAAENIVAVPLAGMPSPLLAIDREDDVRATRHLVALRNQLEEQASGGWGLVVIDPQARFAGVEVESSNALATRFVQECEALTGAPGSPTVLVVAHSSKMARREGTADSRGVTALTDGFRWHATLVANGKDRYRATLNIEKNNYGRPSDPIPLHRQANGLLVAESDYERCKDEQETQSEKFNAIIDRAIEVVSRHDGDGMHRESLAAQVGVRVGKARAAIDAATERGLLVCTEASGRRKYSLPGHQNGWSRPVVPSRPESSGTTSPKSSVSPPPLKGGTTGRQGDDGGTGEVVPENGTTAKSLWEEDQAE